MALVRRGEFYYLRLQFTDPVTGKVHRVFRTTKRRDWERARREANRIELELREKGIAAGKPEEPAQTFKAWVERVLPTLEAGKKRPELEGQRLAHALTAWGDRELASITPLDAAEYVASRQRAGAAGATIGQELIRLKQVFRAAVRQEILAKSPFADVPGRTSPPRERVLTAAEESKLRAHLSPDMTRYVTVALGTGLRAGEQTALTPADIRDGLIHVKPETAKKGKARVVPVRPEVAKAFSDQASSRPEARFWPLGRRAYFDALQAAARKAGIEPATLHDLRRTFATRCAVAGMQPKVLMMILGHTNVAVTLRHYQHPDVAALVEAMQAVTLPRAEGPG